MRARSAADRRPSLAAVRRRRGLPATRTIPTAASATWIQRKRLASTSGRGGRRVAVPPGPAAEVGEVALLWARDRARARAAPAVPAGSRRGRTPPPARARQGRAATPGSPPESSRAGRSTRSRARARRSAPAERGALGDRTSTLTTPNVAAGARLEPAWSVPPGTDELAAAKEREYLDGGGRSRSSLRLLLRGRRGRRAPALFTALSSLLEETHRVRPAYRPVGRALPLDRPPARREAPQRLHRGGVRARGADPGGGRDRGPARLAAGREIPRAGHDRRVHRGPRRGPPSVQLRARRLPVVVRAPRADARRPAPPLHVREQVQQLSRQLQVRRLPGLREGRARGLRQAGRDRVRALAREGNGGAGNALLHASLPGRLASTRRRPWPCSSSGTKAHR